MNWNNQTISRSRHGDDSFNSWLFWSTFLLWYFLLMFYSLLGSGVCHWSRPDDDGSIFFFLFPSSAGGPQDTGITRESEQDRTGSTPGHKE